MNSQDKASDKAEELKGKAKAAVGKATDDKGLEAEGRTDAAKSKGKQFGDDVKDSLKGVKDSLKGSSEDKDSPQN